MKKFLTVLKWTAVILVGGFILLVITRIPYALKYGSTADQVAKIHATKLTLDDVMGKNLPPDPGVNADKTIEGIDANHNGIRDDVELAIFKEYPNSAKTRAVLLQYALALQMETIQSLINKDTVTEVVREQSRANVCLSDTLVPRKTPEDGRTDEQMKRINMYISFVKDRQLNTVERIKARKDFVEYVGSYSESENVACDINLSALSI